MANTMHNRFCPYTCADISSIDSSREHIIPDALGGPYSFSLSADRQSNSKFGDSVDSRLIHAPLVNLMAARFGIETRSGQASAKLKASLTRDDSMVDATFRQNALELRMRSPVVQDESGKLLAVRGFGDSAERELRRVERDFKKKGFAVVAGPTTSLESEVSVRLVHDPVPISQGLAKIAYLATVWTFGDVFTLSPAAALFRTYLTSEPTQEALGLAGLPVVPIRGVMAAMPDLPENYHVIACIRTNENVTTMVRLFNSDFLTLATSVRVPEVSDLASIKRIMAIDCVAKTFEEQDF